MALGNKEHPGRTRGLGVNVPWSLGFAGDFSTYRSRKRSKAEREDRWLQMMTENFEGKLAALQDQVNQLRSQSQATPVNLEVSPARHRSSVASTHNSEHDDVQLPIDGIKIGRAHV